MNPLFRVIARRSMSPSMTAAARAGMIPTMDRTLTGTAFPDGVSSRS